MTNQTWDRSRSRDFADLNVALLETVEESARTFSSPSRSTTSCGSKPWTSSAIAATWLR